MQVNYLTGTDYIGEQHHGTTKIQLLCVKVLTGIVDTAGLPKNDFYLTSQWVLPRNIRWCIFLPALNWDNPELANRVMDEEGRIPVRTLNTYNYWN